MSKAASLKKSVSTKIKVSELPSFDTAEFLKTDEDIALYISLVIEEGNAGELAHALGIAARARGMSGIAEGSGLSREALYKALRPGSAPRFDTVNRVCAQRWVCAWSHNLWVHKGCAPCQ